MTNIAQLIECVILPYSQDAVKPLAMSKFFEVLTELKIEKSLIETKKLVLDIIDREKETNLKRRILVTARLKRNQVKLRMR